MLFGSEPKAILANPAAPPVVTADGLRELLVLVKTPGHAIWSGMREVLVAGVPRCVLLSGGLDSSCLTALASLQLSAHGERVRSFAVDFTGQEQNFKADQFRPTPDAPFVRDVAEHVGLFFQPEVQRARAFPWVAALPESVVRPVKSPYPQTQDAQYPAALQQQAKERLARPGHPVFELVSYDWLSGVVQADPVSIQMRVRNGLERALDLAMWLDMYQPDLRLP